MQTATNFLIQAIIGFALYIVLLRFWMQWVRADFRNELGQFVITVTNPLVIPLRKALPSIGTLDTASVVLAMIVAAIKLFAFMLVTGVSIQPPYFLLIIIGILIKSSIWLFLIAILIGVIASWINPHSVHPIVSVARTIGEPILAPARRIIPPIARLDFSPLIVFLLLQFVLILIAEYLLFRLPV